MFKKFAQWFITFGLSFLVSNVFGWTEQGKAFLWIDLGVMGVFLLIGIIIASHENGGIAILASFSVAGITAIVVAVILFATWGATKLFDVDFFVTYQIMTFGQCLCVNTDNKKMINQKK